MIRKIKKEVGCSFKENIQYMDQTLPVEKSFDIIRREMEIGGKESVFYYIDGVIKDLFDIIKHEKKEYSDNVSIVQDALMKGLEEIKNTI